MGALLRDDTALVRWLEERHGDIHAAEARVAQAQADVGQSRLLLPNPQLDTALGGIVVGATNPPGLDFGQTANFGLGLTQTFDLGKRGPRIEAAELRAKSAKKSFEAMIADKVADARFALARVTHLRARLALLEANLVSAKSVADLERSRLEHGALSGTDYDRLVLDTLSLEADVGRNRAEYAGALAACRAAVFAPCEAGNADMHDVEIAAPLPSSLGRAAEAIPRRADIEAAELEGDAARQDAVLARRRAIPDPSVRLGYVRDQLLIAGSQANTLSLSVSIPLPIFDRGQHDAAKADAHATEQRYVAESMRVAAEAGYGTLTDRAAYLETVLQMLDKTAVPKSSGVLDSTSTAFHQGQVSMTDLLLARRTHLALLLNQMDLRFEFFSVRNDLRRVLGLDALALAGGTPAVPKGDVPSAR